MKRKDRWWRRKHERREDTRRWRNQRSEKVWVLGVPRTLVWITSHNISQIEMAGCYAQLYKQPWWEAFPNPELVSPFFSSPFPFHHLPSSLFTLCAISLSLLRRAQKVHFCISSMGKGELLSLSKQKLPLGSRFSLVCQFPISQSQNDISEDLEILFYDLSPFHLLCLEHVSLDCMVVTPLSMKTLSCPLNLEAICPSPWTLLCRNFSLDVQI